MIDSNSASENRCHLQGLVLLKLVHVMAEWWRWWSGDLLLLLVNSQVLGVVEVLRYRRVHEASRTLHRVGRRVVLRDHLGRGRGHRLLLLLLLYN